MLADDETNQKVRKDQADVQRDQQQDSIMTNFGGEESLRMSARIVEIGLFASRRQPIDVMVDMIVFGITARLSVFAQNERSTIVIRHLAYLWVRTIVPPVVLRFDDRLWEVAGLGMG